MSLRDWLTARLRALRAGSNRLSDFDRELQSDLDLEAEEQQESGASAEEARYAARRAFGNVTRIREELYEQSRWLWWDHIRQDMRYAARMLRKSLGFTATAVVTIALGIGATTAIFSVVDATLLQPLPYLQPDQLVSLRDDFPGLGAQDVGLNEPEWQDLQHSGIFQYVSPTWFDENNLTGSSQPAKVRVVIVAPNYFALLGVKPQLGRAFNPEDHSPGLLTEVVISDGLWKRAFGGDPNILDKSIRMDTDLYRIVGVMPAGFDAPGRTAEERNIEVWAATSFYGAPLVDHPPRNRRNIPTAIARLTPGVTIEQAQSRVDALVASLQKEFPGDYPPQNAWTIRLLPLKERLVGNFRRALILLLGAVVLVLLIGCVNVANLLLARASARGREMAVRQALGAPRKRLISQLLTESLLLSVIGGILGIAVLLGTKAFLLRAIPESLPRLNAVSIDRTVLLFALIVALFAGVVFGLAPALHAGKRDLTHALKEATRGSTGSSEQVRTRRTLVITEVALSLVLMIAAGLLLRSFWGLLNVRLGFNPDAVVSVRTRLPYPNDPKLDRYKTAGQEAPFVREVLRRVRTLQGVEEAAIGDPASIPLDPSQRELKLISDGQFLVNFEERNMQSSQFVDVERSNVTPDYFRVMGISLLRGRALTEFDDERAPQVAVVNEAFARTYWPNQDPLGKHLRSMRTDSPWITVVGLIADARTESLTEAGVPKIYLSLYQDGSHHLAIFLRGHLDAAAISEEVREQVQAVDAGLPVFGSRTLTETVSASLAERRFSMEMITSFALTALLLAGLGIYGVISCMVNERTHEIGLRVALGARRSDILRMVLHQGLRLALSGAAVGLVVALLGARLTAGLLYGVRPTDPLTFAALALLLIAVALCACYFPARRALRADPMVALRYE